MATATGGAEINYGLNKHSHLFLAASSAVFKSDTTVDSVKDKTYAGGTITWDVVQAKPTQGGRRFRIHLKGKGLPDGKVPAPDAGTLTVTLSTGGSSGVPDVAPVPCVYVEDEIP